MASLNGQTIASSYEQLLHVDRDGGGNTTTLVDVKDGDNGTTFALKLATDKISIGATNKLFFDGGGNTYLSETSADILKAYANDAVCGTFRDGGFAVEATGKLWLDGAGDTYIHEQSANKLDFVVGNGTRLVLDANSRISLSNNDSGGTGGSDSTSGNSLFGYLAGASIASGGLENTFYGHKAGNSITTGDGNTLIGSNCATAWDAESNNTAIGYDAMNGGINGAASCVAVGKSALASAHTQTGTIAIGESALGACTSAEGSVAIGYQAANAITSGNHNVAIGYQAMAVGTTLLRNIAIGYQAMDDADAGPTVHHDNVFIGFRSGSGTWTSAESSQNTCIGSYTTGAALDGASNNTALGYNTFGALTTGDNNTTIGSNTSAAITTGINNTAVGNLALTANQTGSYNTAVGATSLDACTGGQNAAFGWASGGAVIGGTNNVLLGTNAGNNITTGSQNTCVGDTAVTSAVGGANQTAIGYGVTGQGDNTVTLGNASVTNVYMASDSGALVHCSGIQFPATQVANAGANVLDDYEEGSHDITITPATSGSFTLHSGYDEAAYTKIGRVVHVQGYVTINSSSSPVGDLRISLPFAAADLGNHSGTSGGTVSVYNMNFNGNFYTLQIDEGAAYFRILEITDNASHDYIEGSELSGDFFFNITYVVA